MCWSRENSRWTCDPEAAVNPLIRRGVRAPSAPLTGLMSEAGLNLDVDLCIVDENANSRHPPNPFTPRFLRVKIHGFRTTSPFHGAGG